MCSQTPIFLRICRHRSAASRRLLDNYHIARFRLPNCARPYHTLPAAAASSSYSTDQDTSTSGATMPKEKSSKLSFQLKTPKGTKDWAGPDVLLRDRIFNTISTVFRAHGAVALDTPVFELKDVLSGKYGEDSKLIYDLQDQGGELCSLRYDLTVPFARWLAMNPDIKNVKRYCIAKVYRRDQPAMTKGRMREFYQCDFDVAGAGADLMVPDAEVMTIIVEVFEALGWNGQYTIKCNHRRILDGVFEVCGVPAEKIRTISSAVDKLDKVSWSEVRREMVEEKGLEGDVADRIEGYVTRKGGRKLLEELSKDEELMANANAKAGVEEMVLLMDYLTAFEVLDDRISFDMSLARGLDYYTGVIYEVVTEGSAPIIANGGGGGGGTTAQNVQRSSKKEKKVDADEDQSDDPSIGVGSVAAGGRYDNLVERFLPKAQMPCVGVSFGVDRIFSITKARMEREKQLEAMRASETDVYVMAFGGKGFDGMLLQRMSVCKTLWDAGIKVRPRLMAQDMTDLVEKAEFSYKLKPKLPAQFKAAESASVPLAVILGEDEQKAGKAKIKEMGLPEGHPEKDGVLVDIKDLTIEIKKRLAAKAETAGQLEDLVGRTVARTVGNGEVEQTN
jgi:histidyl-tRNA synthetase